MGLILTFDLGTTYFKAALFDDRGTLTALARRPLPVVHPTPDRWEIKADDFQHTICDLTHELKETYGSLNSVDAISFATQANSFALLDQNDNPLTPLILWPDRRACDAGASLETILEGVASYTCTGVPKVGNQFSIAKLLWIAKDQPDIWRQARRLVYIGDYLTHWLTGEHVTEAGTVGLTSMLDIQQLRWLPDVLARLDIPERLLPQVARAGTDLGSIRPSAANKLGIPASCRIALGCLDQYAGAIGAGNVVPGNLSETTGTVLATVQCADKPAQKPEGDIFQGPGFDEGIFFRMVFGDVSANLLERYRNSLSDKPSFDELTQAASKVPAGAEGLRLCAKPHLVPPAEMFVNREAKHCRGHEVRAILEAVADALNDQVRQLTGGATPESIRSIGGAARSRVWRQIKADTLGCPVIATACQEPTSLGAAILATSSLKAHPIPDLANQWIKTLPP